MESIYLLIVIVLIVLAVSDLIVGVSNDAVNFLNSAIGSKAAPVMVIMIIASLGILIGTTFSSGLMEVARKGIFHPEQFLFSEIMIIFLAVMITDIILLDLFNTYGLPTSTTVSIVFELLGAAVAISLIKISASPESIGDLGKYINSEKALAIIMGILLSVAIAFTIGAVVQYITRIIFSFQYEKNLKFFGSIWGGIAITAITYFILIKGAEGSSVITNETVEWIKGNSLILLVYSFAGWTILLQLFSWIFKLNIPKFIVLVGTFALAMAFAGNDLVNFIGVPLAGLSSYQEYLDMGHPGFSMVALAEKVKTPTFLLLLAGSIMTITLWFSKKARSVTRTEVNLARQDEGDERFGSTMISRSIVRIALSFNASVKKVIPRRLQHVIDKRFTSPQLNKDREGAAAFDMIRASTNLTIASILISFATSMKLPLSTTYVTFMTAMGTSLADRAWGRESAVYRITGVFTVIGGWFLTAIIAFTVSALFATLIHYTNYFGIILLVLVAVFFVVRTHFMFKKKESDRLKREAEYKEQKILNGEIIISKCSKAVSGTIDAIPNLLKDAFQGLSEENLRQLKEVKKRIRGVDNETRYMRNNVHVTIDKLEEDSIETGHYYVQVLDYLREIVHCLNYIIKPVYSHVVNNHKRITYAQQIELSELEGSLDSLVSKVISKMRTDQLQDINKVIEEQRTLLNSLDSIKKKQIQRIKNNEVGTRNSILYFGILEEIKNLTLFIARLLQAHMDFISYHNSTGKE